MTFEMVPVFVKGEIQLYDMYVNGAWHGSRRTEAQCRQHFDWVTRSDTCQPKT